jgi:ABC-type transport system involved in cytochrome bd biosynthesis fused ATPase/permease subunit
MICEQHDYNCVCTTGLLGEMQLQQGKVRVCGTIAYCDQRPWIMNTTVRDNILFGLEYDEAKFDMALHASSLEDDIKVWYCRLAIPFHMIFTLHTN